MKRLMILAISVFLFFVVFAFVESEETIGSDKEGFHIEIKNNAEFDIYAIETGMYKNGQLRETQGGMNADGSKLKKGGSLRFTFSEADFKIDGDMNLEVVIEKINNISTKDMRYKLESAHQKEYLLEIIGNTITNSEIREVE